MDSKQTVLTYQVCDFDLGCILDCGQSFRWNRQADGSFCGVAFKRAVTVFQSGNSLTIKGADAGDRNLWSDYFDLGRDYGAIKKRLSGDEVLSKAIGFSPGMRILRQQPWEALCSFIISQNNNIPRIKGIVERLCEAFGDEIAGGFYAFPEPERLASLCVEDLAPIRSGFRAKYILDAAKKVAGGEIDLEKISRMPIDDARAELRKITGVGPKVAECALLYGCGRVECFPVDVWIKRALECLYPEGFPREFDDCAGIAQQYLFHYARCCPDCELNAAAG